MARSESREKLTPDVEHRGSRLYGEIRDQLTPAVEDNGG